MTKTGARYKGQGENQVQGSSGKVQVRSKAPKVLLEPCTLPLPVSLLPANKQLEAIFLVIAESAQTNLRRQPHPDIAGKTKIMGSIIDAAPESEWNLPK